MRSSVCGMKETVLCKGGPQEYDGRFYSSIEVDEEGYLLFEGSVHGSESVIYRIDQDADSVQTDHGPARIALYVGSRSTG